MYASRLFHCAIYYLSISHSLQHYGTLICEADMLYVLSIFATMGSLFCESRWLSVRSFSAAENEIAYLHWMHIGRLMGIKVDEANWRCFNDVLQYKNNYEAQFRKHCESNFLVARCAPPPPPPSPFSNPPLPPSKTIYFFSSALPACLIRYFFPLSLHVVSVMQADSGTSAALGLPKPNIILRICVSALLILRALLFRKVTHAHCMLLWFCL